MISTFKGPKVTILIEEYPKSRRCFYSQHYFNRTDKLIDKVKSMASGWALSRLNDRPIYSGEFTGSRLLRRVEIDYDTTITPDVLTEEEWFLLLVRYNLSDLDIEILKILKEVLDHRIKKEDAENALHMLFTVKGV